ncbi:hypothetical protein [Streptomyces sp. ERV7]|uniref:hypothetical protein n=1 Tax=Streptomyces sp. ERV7 TaxID=1322334 RepID=UPI00131C77DD|nr:hypothetical protein [Streptomyces sp. ERV7]
MRKVLIANRGEIATGPRSARSRPPISYAYAAIRAWPGPSARTGGGPRRSAGCSRSG